MNLNPKAIVTVSLGILSAIFGYTPNYLRDLFHRVIEKKDKAVYFRYPLGKCSKIVAYNI